MSASAKFMLAVFYLACFMALFAPAVLAHGNETHNGTHNGTNGGKNGSNGTNGGDDNDNGASSMMGSSVALFGALVAAAVFAI